MLGRLPGGGAASSAVAADLQGGAGGWEEVSTPTQRMGSRPGGPTEDWQKMAHRCFSLVWGVILFKQFSVTNI